MITKEIIIPVYYTENDDKTINIDEDSIREEFEAKLKEVMELYDNKNTKHQ